MTNSASPLTDGERNLSLFNCHFSFVIEIRGTARLPTFLTRVGNRRVSPLSSNQSSSAINSIRLLKGSDT